MVAAGRSFTSCSLGALELSGLFYMGPSGALFGCERVSPMGGPGVTLDQGEAHVEEASSLGFGHAPLYGGNYSSCGGLLSTLS